MDLPVMADTRMDAVIDAPCETIDLTEWVFTLAWRARAHAEAAATSC